MNSMGKEGFFRSLKDTTIPRRVGIGYTMLVFIMLIMAATVISGIMWISSWNDSYRATQELADTANTISRSSVRMTLAGVGVVMSVDEGSRQKFMPDLDKSTTQAEQAFDKLAQLTAEDPESASYVVTMRSTFDDATQLLDSAIRTSQATPLLAAQLVKDGILPAAWALDQLVDAYVKERQAAEDAALDSLDRNARIVVVVVSVLTALGIVLGGLLAVRTSRHVASRLRSAIGSMSTSAAELMAVASQVAASAAQTSASTNETTVTIEEVKQTAALTQEKAAEASDLSQQVVETSKRGEMSAKSNVANFEQIQADMDVVVEAIERLDQQTQSVGDVIATVNDLAEQSNLLSVNASIEAAKAGDYGKGFTVVAQEVKNLAGQSKQGVAQVRAVLDEIQKASRMVVRAAQQSREAVEVGRTEASHAVENNIARVAVGNQTAEATAQISASSRQQLVGMEQIAQAINSINEASKQSVVGTKQVEQEARQLQELAQSLRRLVESRLETETTES